MWGGEGRAETVGVEAEGLFPAREDRTVLRRYGNCPSLGVASMRSRGAFDWCAGIPHTAQAAVMTPFDDHCPVDGP
ncbi:unnamed protein product [Schistocephalus solidus]|uniref:DUF222 domain-containing protein n=1 Tax=Schistocephalus solidus TaxID=70667 RepID=A0A183SGT8_SCHSO|nr:unnamed protein product [Schistocephalus solidus]